MPSPNVQHYDLRGFTADERVKITKRLWDIQGAGDDEDLYLALEGAVLVTNLPSAAVMSIVRHTLEEAAEARPSVAQTTSWPTIQSYDLANFTAEQEVEICERLQTIADAYQRTPGYSFFHIEPRTDANGDPTRSIIKTSLPSAAVLNVLCSVKIQRYFFSGYTVDERLAIQQRLESWIKGDEYRLKVEGFESQIITTDAPPYVVLGLIRSALLEECHYNLVEYAPRERLAIQQYLEEWIKGRLLGGYKITFVGFEKRVIRTNIPMNVVLGLIRMALMALENDRLKKTSPVQKYDLFHFTADEWNRIVQALDELRFQADDPSIIFEAHAHILTTNLDPKLILLAIRSVVRDYRAENGPGETPLPVVEETRRSENFRAVMHAIEEQRMDGRETDGEPEMALFKITITQQDRHYEGFFLSSGPQLPLAAEAALQAGAAASGIQGPANVRYEQVQYQVVGAAA